MHVHYFYMECEVTFFITFRDSTSRDISLDGNSIDRSTFPGALIMPERARNPSARLRCNRQNRTTKDKQPSATLVSWKGRLVVITYITRSPTDSTFVTICNYRMFWQKLSESWAAEIHCDATARLNLESISRLKLTAPSVSNCHVRRSWTDQSCTSRNSI